MSDDNVVDRTCAFCLGNLFAVRFLFEGKRDFICVACVVTLAKMAADILGDDEESK